MAPITCTADYLALLHSLAEPREVLEKRGFTFQSFNAEELLLKRRCSGCGKPMSRLLRRHPTHARTNEPKGETSHIRAALESPSHSHMDGQAIAQGDTPAVDALEEPQFRCRFHLGDCINRVWTCCDQPAIKTTKPCGGALEHVPLDQALPELIGLYQCYPTPLSQGRDLRHAVAIDCEMGQAANGDSELIRITLIDYFSEDVLIDNLVEPEVEMAHLNTRYSGVTWGDIKKARRDKTILRGKAAARKAIWRYVGPHTAVVGHGLVNDLRSLRWFHDVIVDSFITEFGRVKLKEEEEARLKAEEEKARLKQEGIEDRVISPDVANNKGGVAALASDLATTGKKPEEARPANQPGKLSLKTLAKRNLGRDIQMKSKTGHDSLEDAIAARDLVHWNVLKLMGLK
ncbi:hypothetical protein HBI25_123240 [Parastagonospora nodorum]|nr:hypothetical protein HBI10_113960 [Parastagonospora nodorum]KAH4014754.1 hypothetical protein HBI13_170280 [Parastagonospora nodorum]KAH4035181.1 hypothetical protein HBI09_096410 [Parastagonospora nodorum]KAH4048818.1 hypothetical protein HBH49_151590 [Parastagonospora nodorum]KAH4222163.1 hypothetical protein HBI06_146010 [Parastagonospora nodorum]